MVGKNILFEFIPSQVCLHDKSVGGFSGCFAWIKVMCEQQLGYRVPGPAQCEAIVPVEVVLVESYLDGFLDKAVHVSRCKEHMRNIWLDQLEKSAVAEHSINTRYQINFNNVSVLDRASGYMNRLIKEAIQIRLNQNNFNRDNGFMLSWVWNPATKLLFTHDLDPGKVAIEPTH
jgi:hypothetical protein